MPGWVVKQADETAAVACPCGQARRVLTAADQAGLSVHIVSISQDSERHYHTMLTEVYVVIEGEGELELDDQRQPLRVGTVAVIPPGTRHRAVPGPGGLKIINVVRPAFDPEDEHYD
ncbi:MAG: cupin domain-containing protein [Armatimonadetes bacterium]|nr:cupin domain-containing protein [Armatimonadota bacterium]